MFQDNNVVAIDIGAKSIKIVQGKLTNKGLHVSSYGMCSTPHNSFVNNSIADKRDLIKAISDLIIKSRAKAKNVVFGIKGNDVITRHIEMPIMPDKQLKQAVTLDMVQYLPMDPNEYVIDSKKIGRVDSKEKKMFNILLVAAPKKKINDYYFIADKLDLKVNAIDIQVNSASRLFEQKDAGKGNTGAKKCIAYIDIGYESSVVILLEEGKLFFEREIGMGIKDIDMMLKKAYASSEEDIESIRKNTVSLNSYQKGSGSGEDPRVYYSNNTARQIIDTFVDNIIKVFDFYTSSGFGKNISCIYLSGGGAMLNGIAEYIGTSLNIETKVFSTDLLRNINNMDDNLEGSIGLYLNCISLLLRKD